MLGGVFFFFLKSGFKCLQEDKLKPTDISVHGRFGSSVDVSGTIAVIGSANHIINNIASGAAYIFELAESSWTQDVMFVPTDQLSGQGFGSSASISENAEDVVIGSKFDNDNGIWAGSAYVYKRTGSSWQGVTKLLPNDGAVHDLFGEVSISGDIIIIGAPEHSKTGSVYVFRRENDLWIETDKIVSCDARSFDGFGSSVDLSDGYAVIGATGDDNRKGSAYIFKITENGFREEAKLNASDGVGDVISGDLLYGDLFGVVGIFEDHIIVGAKGDRNDAGSVYFFSKN